MQSQLSKTTRSHADRTNVLQKCLYGRERCVKTVVTDLLAIYIGRYLGQILVTPQFKKKKKIYAEFQKSKITD